MKKTKDTFKKRLAALLLAQANSGYKKSKVQGWKTAGEVMASEKYSKRCMNRWKVNEDLEPCPCEICSSQDEREEL